MTQLTMSTQRRPWAASQLLAVGLVAAAFTVALRWPPTFAADALDGYEGRLLVVISPSFLIGIVAILAWERFRPVEQGSMFRHPDIALDTFYFVLRPLVFVLVFLTLANHGATLAERLAVFELNFLESWPTLAVTTAAFVLFDFVAYVSHRLAHKIPVLWRIHEVHHSTERLNVFSTVRDHPLETLYRTLLVLALIALIGPRLLVDPTAVFMQGAVLAFHSRLDHSNVRSNLGPLRFILVTPQSHRMHHSAKMSDWNSNYGEHLSIWDRLFGTQHADSTTYATTGLDRADFPQPRNLRPAEVFGAYSAQLAWPGRREPDPQPPTGVVRKPASPRRAQSAVRLGNVTGR